MPLQAVEQIPNNVFRETIDCAVKEVCRSMMSSVATPVSLGLAGQEDGTPLLVPLKIDGEQVVGTIGYIGELRGFLSVYFGEKLSVEVTSQMLGMTEDEVREAGHDVVNDTVGELANMTAGAFKNQLADRGYPCKLTVPSILRGFDILLEHSAVSVRRVYRYEVKGQDLFIDFQIGSQMQGTL